MPTNKPAPQLSPKDRLIFALDVPMLSDALHLCGELRNEVGLFKVGLELFSAIGRIGLASLMNVLGHSKPRIMLDLKLHDIPATVSRTIKQFQEPVYGVKAITVHCAGGPSMLKAAVGAAGDIHIFAVTALTSMSDEDVQAVDNFYSAQDCVLARARTANACNCDAIIASPLEVPSIHSDVFEHTHVLGTWVRPMLVTPGIRPEGSPEDDQKRKATPFEAIEMGSDYIVVGRPIRDADNSVAAAREIVSQIESALEK